MIDLKDAQSFLPYVTEKLEKEVEKLKEDITVRQAEIQELHEYYWDNYTEMDEYGYENFDNQQALFGEIGYEQILQEKCKRYIKMISSPFFGRVDFQYDDEDEPETFYIGIGNFCEDVLDGNLIYDWRAPVCSLFYDYDKGPASYTAPMGEISGEILAKYQYKIRYGKIVYAFESDIKIDDEILKQELAGRGQDKLKAIITTIQKEQNAIIRNTKDRILVIQGSAGSGKTSIALHRIAYLLYHDREHLRSSNILILSPNNIFADYISQILPELGEENIQEMSFDHYAGHFLHEEARDCEDRYEYLERELSGVLSTEDLKRFDYKQSKEFASQMEGFLLGLEDSLMQFKQVSYKKVTFSKDKLLDYFYTSFASCPLLSRMGMIADQFIDEVETLKDKDLSPEEKQMLQDRFYAMYRTRDIYQLYSEFLIEQGMEPLESCPWSERSVPYEDVYPLLYFKFRLLRINPDPRIRHLVVDEMQDYSWMQYQLLSQLFSCRMTILGDKAQTLGTKPVDVLKFLPGIFGKKVHQIAMNKCYRNTVEIASYANEMVGLTDIEIIERHGAPVRVEPVKPLREHLKMIAAEMAQDLEAFLAQKAADGKPEKIGLETVAVITLTSQQASQMAQSLKEELEAMGLATKEAVTYLHRDSKAFKKGLTVTTFYLAKGLEFDRVYVCFPRQSPVSCELLTQAKYVAATRAMHELVVMDYE